MNETHCLFVFIKIVYLFFDLLDLLNYGLFALLYGQTVFGILKIIALLLFVLHLTLANKNRTMKCKLCLGKSITITNSPGNLLKHFIEQHGHIK